jgi:hypothetical protein
LSTTLPDFRQTLFRTLMFSGALILMQQPQIFFAIALFTIVTVTVLVVPETSEFTEIVNYTASY